MIASKSGVCNLQAASAAHEKPQHGALPNYETDQYGTKQLNKQSILQLKKGTNLLDLLEQISQPHLNTFYSIRITCSTSKTQSKHT